MDALEIIRSFYPDDDALLRRLLKHSEQVRDKALELAARAEEPVDLELVAAGALLHDIGIGQCDAPGIDCHGDAPYIVHGTLGAKMLRDYGAAHGLDLEAYARICERHTGSGVTAIEVRRQQLPLEARDYLPETAEEALICLADKFFSKSGDMAEKPLPKIRKAMMKFGTASLERFDALCRRFKVN